VLLHSIQNLSWGKHTDVYDFYYVTGSTCVAQTGIFEEKSVLF
jgi:hypothetical protein